MTWTLAQAKDQLSHVVRRAVAEGPQTITVRGRDTAVILGKDAYDRLAPARSRRDFKAYLLAIPSLDGVDLSRDPAAAPDIDF